MQQVTVSAEGLRGTIAGRCLVSALALPASPPPPRWKGRWRENQAKAIHPDLGGRNAAPAAEGSDHLPREIRGISPEPASLIWVLSVICFSRDGRGEKLA